METTWIDVGGLTVRAPVTAGTNLLLAIQCAVYAFRGRDAPSERSRRWADFFAMMALATLAGVFKHGARHLLASDLLTVVLAVSNLASGVAVHAAQEGSLVSRVSVQRVGRARLLIDLQVALHVAANIVLGPEITLLILNTAVGLLPVIVVEAAGRGRERGGVLIAGGLSLSLLTGVVYAVGLSLGPWLNHIDIAHVLMGGSFYAIERGVARDRRLAWT